ncbi:DNA-binding transcriptional regulator, XRE-family HTH domain [Cyclobacterium lianum]|uniref:DNA-binding transcriptional regulator, XRE-family HTH domain n=1 Tax=Cyclobacterium lianum TaxID=388280 RepID=A0A1M7QML8_9BACT|nr:helix-turn-helix transcriptional regulator [Cyclobacterium lianum]SHN32507.1 DNA-binding transcriptional regulator, XRE-family HTH domain [Cyclobacterium lianum]
MTKIEDKIAQLRRQNGWSQTELARKIGASRDAIGKYERGELRPTIDLVKKLAEVLDTTVGYLLGETEDRELLKDPSMIRRLNDIAKFSEQDKQYILYALDAMIKSAKLKTI